MFFVCGFKIWFSLLYDTQIYMRAHTFFLVFFYLVNSVEKKANNFKLFSKNIDLRMQRITLKTCRTFSKHVLQCFCSQEQKKDFGNTFQIGPIIFVKLRTNQLFMFFIVLKQDLYGAYYCHCLKLVVLSSTIRETLSS